MECALRIGQNKCSAIDRDRAFRGRKLIPRHRSHSTDFKRQVVAEYYAGETLHALGRRHDLSRNLIRIWIGKAKAGEFDDEVAAAELLVRYEARIASLERLVGQQALELSFVKKGVFCGPLPTSAPTSVIAGPAVSPSKGGAS